MNRFRIAPLALAALTWLLIGCAEQPDPPATGTATLVVHKTPSCGCCGEWVEHMRQAGFQATVVEAADLSPIKAKVGLPYGLGSCHTAEVEGYFVEGHVPAQDVQRLLAERPDALGLTVPGMPLGSPGMEVPSGQVDAYDVLLVRRDGTTEVFAHHGG
jgi:hypothetical protein